MKKKKLFMNKLKKKKNIFNDIVNIEEGEMYTLNLSYFNFPYTKYGWVSDKFTNIFGPHKKYNDETTEHHRNIAAGLQKIFEKAYIHTIQFCQKQTNMTNLSLAGGSALNCVANGKIKSNSDFNDIYIQPATNDGGTSIGAALWLAHQKNKSLPISTYQDTTYLGPSFSNDKIKEVLDLKGVKYKRVDDPSREAAILLSEHKVIGWFQGRMEFGPRALGNRSILGNPSKNSTKDFINKEVKHRSCHPPTNWQTAARRFNPFGQRRFTLHYRILSYLLSKCTNPYDSCRTICRIMCISIVSPSNGPYRPNQ